MLNIRTLIVDDEKPARDRLLELLQKEEDIEIAGIARDGHEAVSLMKETHVDLLFLDIQMPGMDGFTALRQIPAGQRPVTIFVTAFDKYALQAFESHAIDYLLKPFSDERFEDALQRARSYFQTQAAGALGLRLAKLLEETEKDHQDTKMLDRIALKNRGRITFLYIKDLDWVEAAGVYVHLHAGSESHLFRATLGQLEQRLDPQQFVRVNRSAIVNTDRILEMQHHSNGKYTIILKGGAKVPLSRGYRSQLEQWLHQSL